MTRTVGYFVTCEDMARLREVEAVLTAPAKLNPGVSRGRIGRYLADVLKRAEPVKEGKEK